MRQLIEHAAVFNGTENHLTSDSAIIIQDDKVVEITDREVPADEFDVVLDARGYTIIPGLVDSHIHFSQTAPVATLATYRWDEYVLRSARYAEEILMRGFTTCRDAGGVTVGLKNCIDNGMLKGPRIFPSNAAIVQTCGHDHSGYYSDLSMDRQDTNKSNLYGFMAKADGPDEVLKAARQQLFLGASQIKIMAGGGMATFFDPLFTVQFTLEEMKAAVQAASDFGTYVMAHLYIPASISRALDAGVRSFEHATLMDEDNARRIRDTGSWICVCPQWGAGREVKRSKPFPTLLGTPVRRQKPEISYMVRGLYHQVELINKYDLNFVFGTDPFREECVQDEPRDKQLRDFRRYKEFFGSYRGLKAATGNAYELSKLTTFLNP